jgi:hypothetical protein
MNEDCNEENEEEGVVRVSSEPCKPTTSICGESAHFVRGDAVTRLFPSVHNLCARRIKTCTNFDPKSTFLIFRVARKTGAKKFISKCNSQLSTDFWRRSKSWHGSTPYY